MNNRKYSNQVELLLNVLPQVAKEECFAMHGGTAINMFVLNMPRLSVDIDLTYLPLEDRETSLRNIVEALGRIEQNIKTAFPSIQLLNKAESGKLLLRRDGEEIKIEANLVKRGVIAPPKKMMLCDKTQLTYELSAIMPIVPFGQLYGGKICAALDRQHPRDLFDVKILLENEGFSDEVRQGFIFCLLCSERPFHEIIFPNLKDQQQAMKNQFAGMTDISFSYDDFEQTRLRLVRVIGESLTQRDKNFLLSVKNCEPDWTIYDFARFPAIQWKLQNLQKLKTDNPKKHAELFEILKEKLDGLNQKNSLRLGF